MKKLSMYILIVFLIMAMTVGSTYAFLSAVANSNAGAISANGSSIDINYTGGKKIDGLLGMGTDRNDGLNTTVNISLANNKHKVKANLFINIEQIDSSLGSDVLIWELYKKVGTGVEEFVDKGTFLECDGSSGLKACINGDKLYVVRDYLLSTTNTAFTVYVWIDGKKATNEVVGKSFLGTIGAESEEYTGDIS